MMQPLTKRQREILNFIATSIEANGYAPTLEEIGQRGVFTPGDRRFDPREFPLIGFVIET